MADLPVSRILTASSVDGHGNRAVVFVQGCNSFCAYCHNPETRRMCTACGECAPACPTGALTVRDGRLNYNRTLCVRCDRCTAACRYSSDPRIRIMAAADIMDELADALPFIEGLTLSGGECTLYPEAAAELADAAHRAGKTFFVDTNGALPIDMWLPLAERMDMAMVDLKAAHDIEALTGRESAAADNIRRLAEKGKLYEVRTVLAPSLMDMEAAVKLGAELTAPWPSVTYKLIRYRPVGVRPPSVSRVPTDGETERLAALAAEHGKIPVII